MFESVTVYESVSVCESVSVILEYDCISRCESI